MTFTEGDKGQFLYLQKARAPGYASIAHQCTHKLQRFYNTEGSMIILFARDRHRTDTNIASEVFHSKGTISRELTAGFSAELNNPTLAIVFLFDLR